LNAEGAAKRVIAGGQPVVTVENAAAKRKAAITTGSKAAAGTVGKGAWAVVVTPKQQRPRKKSDQPVAEFEQQHFSNSLFD
jgi:hypothetical protein